MLRLIYLQGRIIPSMDKKWKQKRPDKLAGLGWICNNPFRIAFWGKKMSLK